MYGCFGVKKTLKNVILIIISIVIIIAVIFPTKTWVTKIYAENDDVKVPIIMYHSILNDQSRQGKWVLSSTALENDLKYLKDNGYETVTVNDLINYIYYDTILPEKPIMITFDDGFYNNMVYALPLLEKYDMTAVISVVGEYSEEFSLSGEHNAAYSYVTWDDIKALSQSGRFEIGNHSYSMHSCSKRNGTMKLSNEGEEDYKLALDDDILKLQNILSEKSNVKPIVFTYPFGAISKESIPILKEMGFMATLTCYEKPNYISKNPDCLFGLNRYNRSARYSTEEFMRKALSD